MPDLTGTRSRETGEILAPVPAYPCLPCGKLLDEGAKIALVTTTEQLIANELHVPLNPIRSAIDAAARIRAGSPLNAAAEACLGVLGPNVAAGMAMRYYAGFFEMAKALRYDENGEHGGKIVITPPMRAAYMIDIHGKATKDAIYAAGAKFGWWGIKRPDRTELVYDDGIDASFKDEYLADYYQLYP